MLDIDQLKYNYNKPFLDFMEPLTREISKNINVALWHNGKSVFFEEYAHSNTLFYDYSVYSKLKKFYLNKNKQNSYNFIPEFSNIIQYMFKKHFNMVVNVEQDKTYSLDAYY